MGGPEQVGRVYALGEVHRSIMLKTTAIVFCDRCDASTSCCERGWRAYISAEEEGATSVRFLCPLCAERIMGEDEAVWSD